jgi:anti-sigma factor RsiW
MTCLELRVLESDYVDGILSLRDALRARAHLAGCPGCRYRLGTLQATVAALRGMPLPPPIASDVRDALVGRFRAWAGTHT